MDALRWATGVAFVGVTFAALRSWRLQPIPAARWVVATFVTISAILLSGLVLPDEGEGLGWFLLDRVLLLALLAVPWLLYRFTTALAPAGRRVTLAVHTLVGAILVVTAVLPEFPDEGEPEPGWMAFYIPAALAVWTIVSLTAGVRLWRAGNGQPRLARRRMRLLAAATLLLATVLLVAVTAGENTVVDVATQATILLIAGLFLVGYAPPVALRVLWRRPEERLLRDAELALVSATTFDEVTKTMLPAVAELVGARGAALVRDDGTIAAVHGELDGDATAAAGPFAEHSVTIPMRSGTLVVGTSQLAPMFGDEELALLGSFGVVADLAAERVALLERNVRARTELERSNRELDQFASVASHDLKEPLQVIGGFAELLARRYSERLDDEALTYLDHIDHGVERMRRTIDDMLHLARLGRQGPETAPVDMATVVDESLANLAQAISTSGATVEVGDLPPARASHGLLVQVVQNLVSNAIRYSGGRPPHVRIEGARDGAWCAYSVADRGPGIAGDDHDRIFQPFERAATDDAPAGTGIGLAVVRRIVELHGGKVWVDSAPGAGATFRFTLPHSA